MEFHVKYLVYWSRGLPEIDFSNKKKMVRMDSWYQISSESVQYCLILNVDSQTVHNCLFTFSDVLDHLTRITANCLYVHPVSIYFPTCQQSD